MSYTLSDVRAEYDRLDALCGVDSSGIALTVSKRAVKRLGCFRLAPEPEISISAFVLEDETLFWDTIRHEYAHALVWLRHPREKHGHDAVWKAACREIGCSPRATVAAGETQQALREEKAKWSLRCRSCGQETLYLREGKIVRLIRSGRSRRVTCTRCGGHRFELTELR